MSRLTKESFSFLLSYDKEIYKSDISACALVVDFNF